LALSILDEVRKSNAALSESRWCETRFPNTGKSIRAQHFEDNQKQVGEEAISIEVRLLVEFQGEIAAETNTLFSEMLLDSW
jgi:hypothetical protein